MSSNQQIKKVLYVLSLTTFCLMQNVFSQSVPGNSRKNIPVVKKYYAGTGISIISDTISNTAPSQWVTKGKIIEYSLGDIIVNGTTVGIGSGTAGGNTVVGKYSFSSNTLGGFNTAIGYSSLTNNIRGDQNTAIGSYSLETNITGKYNTAIGVNALYSNENGVGNTADGNNALFFNTTGSYNTGIGYKSFYTNGIGSCNTALGYIANTRLGNLYNAMALGFDAVVNSSLTVVVGNTGIQVIGGQVGWSNFSDGRFKKNIKQNVPGLEFITKLNPVTYTIDIKKLDQFLGKSDSLMNSKDFQGGYAIAEKKIRTGFVAQEVEKTAAQIGYDFDGVNHPQNETDNYSLVYADFVPSLVKAVQEQQQIIGDLQKQIDDLKILVTNLSQEQQLDFSNQQLKTIPGLILEQNIPNPLNNNTTIGYFIPNNLPNALLIVTDMNGNKIKQIALQPGKGNVTIDASTFSAGAYNYMLMSNGVIVASKKMVVTH